MEINLLIDKTEFQTDKLVATSTEEERLKACIREAQQMDLRPLLGDAMYYDIIKNYDVNTTSKYSKLIAGEEYSDTKSNPIIFSGLRMALKYWAFARFISKQQVNVTASSVVIKTNPFSQPTDSKTIAIQAEQARSGAVSYWEETKKYLCQKKDDFPLWEGEKTKPRSGIRISAVGGN